MKNSTRKDYKNYLLVGLCIFIIKLLFFFAYSDYGINSDRIGDLLAPTTLAGLDWKGLAKHVGYYGYGFKWIYFIFFKLTDNPAVIYYCILVMYDLLYVLLGILIYHMLRKHFDGLDNKIAVLLSIIFGVLQPADIKSEPSVYIAGWMVCFFVLKAVNNREKKQNIINAVVLALLLAYCVTLHGRMVALLMAFVIVMIIYRIKFSEWMVNPYVFFILQALFYVLVKTANRAYCNYFWNASEVRNSTAIKDNLKLYFFESIDGLKVACSCLVSNLVTLGTQTYGLGWIAAALFVFALFFLPRKKKGIDYSEEDKKIYAVLWIFGTAVAIVIAGIAVQWGVDVYYGNLYGYKGFVYGRYFVNFAYPAILVSVVWLLRHYKDFEKKMPCVCSVITYVGLVLMSLTFLKFVFPDLQQAYIDYVPTEKTSLTMLDWLLFARLFEKEDIAFNFYINLAIIFVIITVVFATLLCTKKVKDMIVIYLSIVLSFVLFSNTNGFSFEKPKAILSSCLYDTTYHTFKDFEANEINLKDDIIYTDYAPWPLQFKLNRYKISYDWNEISDNPDKSFVFVSVHGPDIELQNIHIEWCYYIVMDGTEYMYFNDDGLRQRLESAGYPVYEAGNRQLEGSRNYNYKLFDLEAVDTDYRIVFVNDMHIITENDNIGEEYVGLVDERHNSMYVDEKGIKSDEKWLMVAEEIDVLSPDLVVFNGDMLDFYSDNNMNVLKEGMKEIETPVMYIRSDHDYSLHYTSECYSMEDVYEAHRDIDGDPEVWYQDCGEFDIIGISKSYQKISEEGLDKVKNILQNNKPVLLVSHVPYDSLVDKDFRQITYQNRGIYNMWGMGNRYVPDGTMVELMELIYNGESGIDGVIGAHLHFEYDTMITETKPEYILAPSYEKGITVVDIK